jgi:hypothetical protein
MHFWLFGPIVIQFHLCLDTLKNESLSLDTVKCHFNKGKLNIPQGKQKDQVVLPSTFMISQVNQCRRQEPQYPGLAQLEWEW